MPKTSVGITFEEAYCYGTGKYTNYRCLEMANPGLIFWFISIFLVFALIATLTLTFRVLRSKKKSIISKTLFTIVSVFAILALLYMEAWNLEHTSYGKISTYWEEFKNKSQARRVNIPNYVVETANNLIIDRIGEDRFNKDIRYNEVETKKVNKAKVLGNVTHQLYKVAYNYTPLEILNGSKEDSLFYVNIVNKDSPYYNQQIFKQQGIVNDRLPDCAKNATLCDFHLTAKDAIKIAKKNGFNASDLNVKWRPTSNRMLTIELSSCSENKVMHLDYTDGSLIDFKDEVICGGVF